MTYFAWRDGRLARRGIIECRSRVQGVALLYEMTT
jgi:hypothetical protein